MKKITFKNAPSTETPLSAENLNLMQANAEEELNRINGELNTTKLEVAKIGNDYKAEDTRINAKVSNLETYAVNNKIEVEEWLDLTPRTVQANKWDVQYANLARSFGTKNLLQKDGEHGSGFIVLENGLYEFIFSTTYEYQKITGFLFYEADAEKNRIIFQGNGNSNSFSHTKLLQLKKGDKVRFGVYTDDVGTFKHCGAILSVKKLRL